VSIDAILVPRGAEYETVCLGVQAGGEPRPSVVALPVGPEPVRRFLEVTLPEARWRRVLVTGLCGGLAPGLETGDLALYSDCLAPGEDPLATDRELGAVLEAVLPRVFPVRALTVSTVVAAAAEKRRLFGRYHTQVVDMESHTALGCLAAAGVAATVVRVVCDVGDQDLPDLGDSFDREGNLQPVALALAMVREPLAGVRLIGSSIAALAALEQVARQFGRL